MPNHIVITKKIILKSLYMVFLFAICAGFNKSDAQSVVGQWKQVSVKAYSTPEAIQNSQGHLKAVMEMPKVDATEEFHSDNSFVETIHSEGKIYCIPAGRYAEYGSDRLLFWWQPYR